MNPIFDLIEFSNKKKFYRLGTSNSFPSSLPRMCDFRFDLWLKKLWMKKSIVTWKRGSVIRKPLFVAQINSLPFNNISISVVLLRKQLVTPALEIETETFNFQDTAEQNRAFPVWYVTLIRLWNAIKSRKDECVDKLKLRLLSVKLRFTE